MRPILITLIMGLIFTETTLARDVHLALPSVLLDLGAVAHYGGGSQGSLVGLAPSIKSFSRIPITYKCCEVAHKGDNLDRYLLGRQFMVVVMVFTINISGPHCGCHAWGFPDVLTNMFLGSGLAMILFTCMIGQLNSQVTASLCMLDYINNYFMVFTLWVSNAIEFSGLFLRTSSRCSWRSLPVRQLNPMRHHWSPELLLLPPLPWIARHPRIFLRCDLGWSIRGQDHHVGRCPEWVLSLFSSSS
jgi:hypothetical protein